MAFEPKASSHSAVRLIEAEMIRSFDFNSFPATAALERQLQSRKSAGRSEEEARAPVSGITGDVLDIDDVRSFPVIQWCDDEEPVVAKGGSIRQASNSLAHIKKSEQKHGGLVRSSRVRSKLSLLAESVETLPPPSYCESIEKLIQITAEETESQIYIMA